MGAYSGAYIMMNSKTVSTVNNDFIIDTSPTTGNPNLTFKGTGSATISYWASSGTVEESHIRFDQFGNVIFAHLGEVLFAYQSDFANTPNCWFCSDSGFTSAGLFVRGSDRRVGVNMSGAGTPAPDAQLEVMGTFHATDVSTIDGATTINNTFHATGVTTIDSATTVNSTVHVTGNVTLDAAVSAIGLTNKVRSVSADTAVAATDTIMLMTGAHTATLPTAVGIPGKAYTIICSSAGTNKIGTTSAQTISGFALWTNSAVNKFVTVVSDNANWWVINASTPP